MKCLIDADYVLYDDGRVWSPYKSRFLKPYTGKNGYPYYTFKGGNREYIHRLLAIHFLGMEDGQEVNHKDFDRGNYSLDNLEVVSRSDNLKHAHTRSSRKKVKSYRHSNCKITDEQVIEIRNSSDSERKLAVKYGISARAIHNIKHRNTYQWVL